MVRLTAFGPQCVQGEVLSVRPGEGEPRVNVTLYQGLLKGDKFQWILQKGTELGVAAFVPLICRRSVPRATGGPAKLPNRRWERIATEAAEQSGRCIVPRIGGPMSLQEACDSIPQGATSIIPWEAIPWQGIPGDGERCMGLAGVLGKVDPSEVNLFVGPEGGFEEEEVAYARSRGVVAVTLGKRILRSETAAIATVEAVMYRLGELGS